MLSVYKVVLNCSTKRLLEIQSVDWVPIYGFIDCATHWSNLLYIAWCSDFAAADLLRKSQGSENQQDALE